MNSVFIIVYSLLVWLSGATGLSYNEVNIVAYYFIVPAIFLFLVDRIIKKKYICSISLVIAWFFLLVTVSNFSNFANRVFDGSVAFLKSFSIIGWDYTVASVIICVVIPGIAFCILFYFAFPKLFRQHSREGDEHENQSLK